MPFFTERQKAMTYKDELCFNCKDAYVCSVFTDLNDKQYHSDFHEQKIKDCKSYRAYPGDPEEEG